MPPAPPPRPGASLEPPTRQHKPEGPVAAACDRCLSVLLDTSESVGKRAHAAETLQGHLATPAGRTYAQQHVLQLLPALEQLLHERSSNRLTTRRRAPALLGAVGAALRPNIAPFCSWIIHASRLASARQEFSAPGKPSLSVCAALMRSMHECLVLLQRAQAAACALPCLADVLACVRAVLDETNDASLLAALLPLLMTLSEDEFAQALVPHFADVTDVLLGWVVDTRTPLGVCAQVFDFLRHAKLQWEATHPFGGDLLLNLLSDLEGSAAEAARLRGLRPAHAVAAEVAVTEQRLERLLALFAAVVIGHGHRLAAITSHQHIAARALAVLVQLVDAPPLRLLPPTRAAPPAADAAGFPPDVAASAAVAARHDMGVAARATDADVAASMSAAKPPAPPPHAGFVHAANECLRALAEALRRGFAPSHALALRLLLPQLSPSRRVPPLLRVFALYHRLVHLEGNALPALASQALLSAGDPFVGLRSHPEPKVVAALLAAHRSILLGPSGAAAAVLLQGQLQELQHILVGLSSAASAAAPMPHPEGSGRGVSASESSVQVGGGAASGAVSDTSPSTAPHSREHLSPSPSDSGTDSSQSLPLPQSLAQADEASSPPSHSAQHLQFHLSLLALVLCETSHASQLVSVAGTVLRHAHPLRHPVLRAHRGLAVPVLSTVLAATHNTTLTLSLPPGTDKPTHSSLRALAAEVRGLLFDVFATSEYEANAAAQLPQALRATALAIRTAADALVAEAPGAPAADVASTASADSVSAGRAGRGVGAGGGVVFAAWLGVELGAWRCEHSVPRFGQLLRYSLTLLHHSCAEVRAATLGLARQMMRCPPMMELPAAALAKLLQAACAQLRSADDSCRRLASKFFTLAAPAAMVALNPHVPARLLWIEQGQAENSTLAEDRAAPAELWRERLSLRPEPCAGFGSMQLQRALKLVSGSVPPSTAAMHRLWAVSQRDEPSADASPIASMPGSLPKALPQLSFWWVPLDTARFLVQARLRSPFGGPAQTFETLERMLSDALAADGATGVSTAQLLLHTLECLEMQIHLATNGSLANPVPPRTAHIFFVTNRRVCSDWFSRIRPRLIRVAAISRQPASVVRHAQLRLSELLARASTLTGRSPSSGRIELLEGQGKSAASLLRDTEWTALVLTDALIQLGATHALDGVAHWMRKKLGPLHAAAERRASPASLRAQPQSQAQHGAGWAPWLEGARLHSQGRLEEALAELRRLAETPPLRAAGGDAQGTASGANSNSAALEPVAFSFVSAKIASCQAQLCDWQALREWQQTLDQYRAAAAAAMPPTAATAAASAPADAKLSGTALQESLAPHLCNHLRPSTLSAIEALCDVTEGPDRSAFVEPAAAGWDDMSPPAAALASWTWLRDSHLNALPSIASTLGQSGTMGCTAPPHPGSAQQLDGEAQAARALGEWHKAAVLSALALVSGCGDTPRYALLQPILHLGCLRALVSATGAGSLVEPAWPAHDAAAMALEAQAQHVGSWQLLLRCEERRARALQPPSATAHVGREEAVEAATDGSNRSSIPVPHVLPRHDDAPTPLVGLRLALAKLARRHRCPTLASRLLAGLKVADQWANERRQYEELLLLHASERPAEAIASLWEVARPLLATTSVPVSDAQPGRCRLEQVTRCKMLLKMARWLQDRQHEPQLGEVILDMSGWVAQQEAQLDGAFSDIGGLASVDPDAAAACPDGAAGLGIAAAEKVCMACLHKATLQAPSHAKAQLRWGNWCYKQGSAMLKALTGRPASLTTHERAAVGELVEELFSHAVAQQQNAQSTLCELLATHDRLGSSSDEATPETPDRLAEAAERELLRRFADAFPEVDADSVAPRLLALWHDIRRRLLAPVQLAVRAFFRFLRLSEETTTYGVGSSSQTGVAVPLRLLRLLLKYGLELQVDFVDGLASTPSVAWRGVVPQLFARLAHPEPFVRQHVQELLCYVGKQLPELVLYPALVARRSSHGALGVVENSGEAGPTMGRAEVVAICETLRMHNPTLVVQLELFIGELAHITLLPEEQTDAVLQSLQADVAARAGKLRQEAARVAANTMLGEEDKRRILREKYSAIMMPVLQVLEAHEAAMSAPPGTPHEASYQSGVFLTLQRAIAVFRLPKSSGFDRCWDPFRGIQRHIAATLRQRSLELAQLSPRLATLSATHIPMPGLASDSTAAARASGSAPAGASAECQSVASTLPMGGLGDVIRIERMGSTLAMLSSKTRPKKLAIIGSDGQEYGYLLKGREDLHLDERIMQFLRVANGLLRTDRSTRGVPLLRARHYAVLPLGARSGLIQWVQSVSPLYGVYKSSQLRAQQQAALRDKMGASSAEGGADADAMPMMRPSVAFYAKLRPALKARGIATASPRRDWPHELLRRVVLDLVAETPRELLSHELWVQSADTHEWWLKTQTFARSTAVMSILGYVIGLGDRHLDNILLDFSSGEVVHIDYNVCFESGLRLQVPETVPFRMTHTMQAALGVGGIEGTFSACCELVMRVLRHSKETLLTLLEAFVYDPLVDWAADRVRDEQRKEAELSVGLSLAASRVDELRGPIEQWQQQLLPALRRLRVRISDAFDAYEAQQPPQLKREALQASVCAAELELRSAVEEEQAAASMLIATDAELVDAGRAAAASTGEMRAALDAASRSRASHVQAVELLIGGEAVAEAADRLAVAAMELPPEPAIASRVAEQLLMRQPSPGADRSSFEASASRSLQPLYAAESGILLGERELLAAVGELLRWLDTYASATRGLLPSHAQHSAHAAWADLIARALREPRAARCNPSVARQACGEPQVGTSVEATSRAIAALRTADGRLTAAIARLETETAAPSASAEADQRDMTSDAESEQVLDAIDASTRPQQLFAALAQLCHRQVLLLSTAQSAQPGPLNGAHENASDRITCSKNGSSASDAVASPATAVGGDDAGLHVLGSVEPATAKSFPTQAEASELAEDRLVFRGAVGDAVCVGLEIVRRWERLEASGSGVDCTAVGDGEGVGAEAWRNSCACSPGHLGSGGAQHGRGAFAADETSNGVSVHAVRSVLADCRLLIADAQRFVLEFNRLLLPEMLKVAHVSDGSVLHAFQQLCRLRRGVEEWERRESELRGRMREQRLFESQFDELRRQTEERMELVRRLEEQSDLGWEEAEELALERDRLHDRLSQLQQQWLNRDAEALAAEHQRDELELQLRNLLDQLAALVRVDGEAAELEGGTVLLAGFNELFSTLMRRLEALRQSADQLRGSESVQWSSGDAEADTEPLMQGEAVGFSLKLRLMHSVLSSSLESLHRRSPLLQIGRSGPVALAAQDASSGADASMSTHPADGIQPSLMSDLADTLVGTVVYHLHRLIDETTLPLLRVALRGTAAALDSESHVDASPAGAPQRSRELGATFDADGGSDLVSALEGACVRRLEREAAPSRLVAQGAALERLRVQRAERRRLLFQLQWVNAGARCDADEAGVAAERSRILGGMRSSVTLADAAQCSVNGKQQLFLQQLELVQQRLTGQPNPSSKRAAAPVSLAGRSDFVLPALADAAGAAEARIGREVALLLQLRAVAVAVLQLEAMRQLDGSSEAAALSAGNAALLDRFYAETEREEQLVTRRADLLQHLDAVRSTVKKVGEEKSTAASSLEQVEVDLKAANGNVGVARAGIKHSVDEVERLMSNGRAMAAELMPLLDSLTRLTSTLEMVAHVHSLAGQMRTSWHTFQEHAMVLLAMLPHVQRVTCSREQVDRVIASSSVHGKPETGVGGSPETTGGSLGSLQDFMSSMHTIGEGLFAQLVDLGEACAATSDAIAEGRNDLGAPAESEDTDARAQPSTADAGTRPGLRQEKNMHALTVLRRIKCKLDGKDKFPGKEREARQSVAEQVEMVIKQATSMDNLCHLYEGWAAWL